MNAADLSLAEAADALRAGEVSSRELTEACLERVERLNPRLNAFTVLTAERALAEAAARDEERAAGRAAGLLHGIPMAHKDLFDAAGLPTTGACAAFADRIASEDAPAIARLQAAGTVLLGKLNMHECAYGITSDVSCFGPVRNPWDLERVPGGSSGGSAAAVATGCCFAALGTDTGGSIRLPASLCGIVGLKPTYGRVSRRGVLPLAWSLDHVGPLTRTVRDAALLLEALAGHDPEDPASADAPAERWSERLEEGIAGLRLGVPKEYFWDHLEPDVEAPVRAAIAHLESLGARVEEVSLPCLDWIADAHALICACEATAVHEQHMRERGDRYAPILRVRLAQGLFIPAADYLLAQRARLRARDELAAALREFDALLTPTHPLDPPRLDELASAWEGKPPRIMRLSRCMGPYNLTGLPALTVPCGFSAAGLPVGLQIAARPFAEATVLRLGHAYEQSQPLPRTGLTGLTG